MKHLTITMVASLSLVFPCWAQDWGSGYNMGSIGVLGGNAASGTINITCADAGNAVVPQGAFSIFLKPRADSMIGMTSPGTLTFAVDGESVALPVSDDEGDGFVYDKTQETLADAIKLIDRLKGGKRLSVAAAGENIATIGLKGAAAALDGVEVCLAP